MARRATSGRSTCCWSAPARATRARATAPSCAWLRGLARRGVALGGISLGAYVLAHAGLLDGRRCALHWESLAAFAERFPRIRTTTDIFVIDGNRHTCSGGTAALDMMLQLITERDGRALANGVSEQFIHPRIRGTRDSQRMAVQSRLGVANEKLIAAVGLMEDASEDPRPVQRIAADVGLSPRQLERLFAKYLRTSPSQLLPDAAPRRARAMLLQTTQPDPRRRRRVRLRVGVALQPLLSRAVRPRPSDERMGKASTKVARTARQS